MVTFGGNEGSLLRRITELEAQIAAFQADEERTTIALAQSSVGIFDSDIKRQTVFVSPNLQDMLGYECGSLPEQLDKTKRPMAIRTGVLLRKGKGSYCSVTG